MTDFAVVASILTWLAVYPPLVRVRARARARARAGVRARDRLGELVDALASVVGVAVLVLGAEVAPLPAVDGPQVTLLALGEAYRVEVLAWVGVGLRVRGRGRVRVRVRGSGSG